MFAYTLHILHIIFLSLSYNMYDRHTAAQPVFLTSNHAVKCIGLFGIFTTGLLPDVNRREYHRIAAKHLQMYIT